MTEVVIQNEANPKDLKLYSLYSFFFITRNMQVHSPVLLGEVGIFLNISRKHAICGLPCREQSLVLKLRGM